MSQCLLIRSSLFHYKPTINRLDLHEAKFEVIIIDIVKRILYRPESSEPSD